MVGIDDQGDFIIQLRKEFLDEVSFLLEQCEESYLKLENPTLRTEELTNIFRLAHSIKGSGTVVGYDDLAEFAHVVEDCLTLLRDLPERVTPEITSLLLKAGDAFKTRVEMLKKNSPDAWNIADLKVQIVATTQALKGVKQSEVPTPALTVQTPQEVQSPTATPTVQPHQPTLTLVTPPAAISSMHAAPAKQDPTEHHEHPEHHDTHAHENSHSKSSQGVSVKVDSVRIDAVLDLVGELVVIKSQLLQERSRVAHLSIRENEVLALLDKTVRDLQDKTLSMRMTSLKPLFLKVQRTVRDLAIKLNKPIEFTMSGEDIEIDRTMIELLNDPLIHIVRNALDHGIEKGAQRKLLGKTEKGFISMTAKHAGGRIVVEIKDDGSGIDREKVLAKAINNKIISETQRNLTNQQVYDLIFAPGFSTADAVTDISGRGVGLDVVKSNIQKLKGTIEIDTEMGKGSIFRLSLPLTTAITEGIVVIINQIRYVIPMDSIRELLRIEAGSVTNVRGEEECLSVRGRILPLVKMNLLMKINGISNTILEAMNLKASQVTATKSEITETRTDMVVVIDHLGYNIALTIDAVLGQNQVVVKPLGQNINTTNGVAGAAIMGDGKIALVLDLDGLVRYVRASNSQADRIAREKKKQLKAA